MIELKSIKKKFENNGHVLTAIEDISLSIANGELVAIIGPSGCGKTTLLKLIAGLTEPTQGTIRMEGLEVRQNAIKSLSIVFQNTVLLPWRNVISNIRLPNELGNRQLNDNVLEKIRLVGLEGFEKSYPHQLSGGMAQRAAIARALVVNPELLLLDEPFGALDEIGRNKLNVELLNIFEIIRPTVLFVTHSITEAVFLADKVIILSNRPSKVKEIVGIKLPRPRDLDMKESVEFQGYVKCIREKLE